ncbi:hypothetical protein ASD15_22050 [Massilia sp. Root351]|jgi:hypothetical protein|uniref:DUF3800 domain-containing protein n=1 Tax=Massilia sp. Root351 TaxID=1736522 RepID=UPI000709C31B|nr:DUF3800 domain-containing protein [Massilia sp. Root351]KQV78497.1 hypothetical protein ASD15_22050 [Massilia sp. Root351]
MSYICYIDEAGCSTALPSATTDIQPVLAIGGLIVPQAALADLTTDFLKLKRKFFPGQFQSAHLLDDVRQEIKGSDVRGSIRKLGTKASTQLRFADEVLALLEHYSCRILGAVWVKGIAKPFKHREVYTRSVQMACKRFQDFLEDKKSHGLIIADFRTTQLNDQVAHSIFTQKYRAKGDPYSRILELPTFGVSNNHVGLQLTDVLCSTMLFPMATSAYMYGHLTGVHVNARDLIIRRRYAKRLKNLQFRLNGDWSLHVTDFNAGKPSAEIFVVPPVAPKKAALGGVAPTPVAVAINLKPAKRKAAPIAMQTVIGQKLIEATQRAAAKGNSGGAGPSMPPTSRALPTDAAGLGLPTPPAALPEKKKP